MFAKGPDSRVGKAFSLRDWVLDTKTPLVSQCASFLSIFNIVILNRLDRALEVK